MNSKELYKTLAEQREEALFNERLATGAMFEKGIGEWMVYNKVTRSWSR
jgi:hypothetical protein